MSFAGHAANSSGCVARPKEHATGLIGFAAQIRRSSLTGSYVMETAEHREPYESRGSRTVLGARGGEIPPRDSTFSTENTRGRRSIHVRGSPNSERKFNAVVAVASCQLQIHALQQRDARLQSPTRSLRWRQPVASAGSSGRALSRS